MKIKVTIPALVVSVAISFFLGGCAAGDNGTTTGAAAALTVDRFVLQPVTVTVRIIPNATRPEIDSLRKRIEEDDAVGEVLFTSQQEALEILRKRLGDDADLLPPDLAWELSPTFEITLDTDADIEEFAAEVSREKIVDNSPGAMDGVEYNLEPWHLELKDDETFVLVMGERELTGSYKIFRDSITLIEATGEQGVFEGEITGTSIRFEAFPGVWEKE